MNRRQMMQAASATPLGLTRALSSPRESPVFVLLHGAWHGGWCYARVADLLRAYGYRVFTPTLSGLAERSHLAGSQLINCRTHIDDILNLIKWERLTDIALCGHSYGGMVLGAVADAIPERIRSVLYLDAVIPRNGQCGLDGADPEQLNQVLRAVAECGGHMLPPLPARFFNVNANDLELVDRLCTAQPFATLVDRLALTGRHMSVASKTFVLARGWAGSNAIRESYDMARRDRSWRTLEIACGHEVMLDEPEWLAATLLESALGAG